MSMPNPKDYYCEDCDVMYEFCKLVDAMHKDIQHLESEIVRTRYELSRYLDTPYNEYLQSDILSNLAARYYDYLAYESYVICNGIFNNDNLESFVVIGLPTEL